MGHVNLHEKEPNFDSDLESLMYVFGHGNLNGVSHKSYSVGNIVYFIHWTYFMLYKSVVDLSAQTWLITDES